MNIGLNFSLLESLYQELIIIFPKIIGGIVFIILSYLILKLIVFITKYVLKLSKIENIKKALNNSDALKNTSMEIDPARIIMQFVKCFVILLIIIIGSDIFGLSVVSIQIGRIIDYLPQFFSAVLIFAGGFYLANYIKSIIRGLIKSIDLNGANIIGSVIFYIILIFTIITALNQAGVNTDLITNNLSLILGSIFLTLAIAFGLGSKDIIYRLLLSFYTNRNFEIGQRVIIDENVEGVILAINNICMTIQTKDEKIVYPIKMITNKKIRIIAD
ncbi:mechanosensitive ion channel family protein [Algoriella sp.]|uniref:mechanosensitive ion channel family protein n=1 Tax=Algoriella sp. TaxID=1872434 RepID=UPI001B0DC724|nr:small-conductance mechanosensitive channel [Algoriella sp.]MBO6211401.1 small-conductance mechanosensitive channel [Algoriella sp.]